MTWRRRDQGGAVLVEAALVLPLFFILLSGLIDLGYWNYENAQVANAARDGARQAMLYYQYADTYGTCPGGTSFTQSTNFSACPQGQDLQMIQSAIASHLTGRAFTATVTCYSEQPGFSGTTESCSSAVPGTDEISVVVTTNRPSYAFIGPKFGSNTITQRSTLVIVGLPKGGSGSNGPSITVTPSNETVGQSDTVTVSGGGFAANSALTASVTSGTITTNISATTSPSGNIPAGTTFVMTNPSNPAVVAVKITDASNDSATATFNVTTALNPSITVAPSDTRKSKTDTVTVTGSGFEANSTLTAAVTSGNITTNISATTDASGNIPPGTTFVMTNPSNSGVVVTVTVTDGAGNSGQNTFTTTP